MLRPRRHAALPSAAMMVFATAQLLISSTSAFSPTEFRSCGVTTCRSFDRYAAESLATGCRFRLAPDHPCNVHKMARNSAEEESEKDGLQNSNNNVANNTGKSDSSSSRLDKLASKLNPFSKLFSSPTRTPAPVPAVKMSLDLDVLDEEVNSILKEAEAAVAQAEAQTKLQNVGNNDINKLESPVKKEGAGEDVPMKASRKVVHAHFQGMPVPLPFRESTDKQGIDQNTRSDVDISGSKSSPTTPSGDSSQIDIKMGDEDDDDNEEDELDLYGSIAAQVAADCYSDEVVQTLQNKAFEAALDEAEKSFASLVGIKNATSTGEMNGGDAEILTENRNTEQLESAPKQSEGPAGVVDNTMAANVTENEISTAIQGERGQENQNNSSNVSNSRSSEKAEQERIERERIASEKAKQERLEAGKKEKARIIAAKAEEERIAAKKAEQEKIKERERIDAKKAERERLEAIEQENMMEAARIAAEQAEKERIAVEKAEEAEQYRIAAEMAEKERLEAQDKAEEAQRARIAAEKAEQDRIAAEEVEKERLEKAKREEDARAAPTKKVEQERLAKEQCLTKEKAIEEAARPQAQISNNLDPIGNDIAYAVIGRQKEQPTIVSRGRSSRGAAEDVKGAPSQDEDRPRSVFQRTPNGYQYASDSPEIPVINGEAIGGRYHNSFDLNGGLPGSQRSVSAPYMNGANNVELIHNAIPTGGNEELNYSETRSGNDNSNAVSQGEIDSVEEQTDGYENVP